MKLYTTHKYLFRVSLLLFLFLSVPCFADLDSRVTVNLRNAPIRNVFEIIAAKVGLQLVMDAELTQNVTISENAITAKKLLEKLAVENSIEYLITGTQLIVDKTKPGGGSQTGGDSHEIILKNAMASELVNKIGQVFSGDGKLLADEHSNKLIYLGSQKSFDKLKSLVSHFDSPQRQIMIEAIIVETTHNFLQQIGIALGSSNSSNTVSGSINTSGPTAPNITFNALLGRINSNALNVKLTAAETKGDAKIVSRPKVVTLNNRAAKVESGVTFNIKTLSNVSAGTAGGSATGAGQGVVTGTVTSIDAVLSLNILPLLIGEDEIKLTVDINDSSPDLASSVDGIPGILKNTASTAVIIKNRQTAVIAGLVKQSKSKSATGVPFLSQIPILGWLFRSNSVSDTNSELVIFLTPTIDESSNINIKTVGVDPALLVPSPLDPQ